jgi:hypothetical protein
MHFVKKVQVNAQKVQDFWSVCDRMFVSINLNK